MNLREAVLEEHSKAQADKIAAYIGSDQDRMDELMFLIFNDEYRVVQRATYSLKKVGDKYPHMILPYLETMIPMLRTIGIILNRGLGSVRKQSRGTVRIFGPFLSSSWTLP